jgi:hypothetical protein
MGLLITYFQDSRILDEVTLTISWFLLSYVIRTEYIIIFYYSIVRLPHHSCDGGATTIGVW